MEIRSPLEPDENAPVGAMVRLAGCSFLMGSDFHYEEERPAHRRFVGDFSIDAYPVTNASFAAFVDATGHLTIAEHSLDPAEYPGVEAELLQPASLVFMPPSDPSETEDFRRWWSLMPYANWRNPLGPGSSIEGLQDHPVVHVGFADAFAYAQWVGKALPSEAEWEYAARGGLDGAEFAWGASLTRKAVHVANTWQGIFPRQNLMEDGFLRTSPVDTFPPNRFGLFDMIGNVWEWTEDSFALHQPNEPVTKCCGDNLRPSRSTFKVLKGGSHLCAPNYCQRYRPAARLRQSTDTTAGHIGFRCASRP